MIKGGHTRGLARSAGYRICAMDAYRGKARPTRVPRPQM